jgi:ArsR family transcriptional regulator
MPDIPSRKAEFFKVLGHPLRIRILEVLAGGERSVSELVEHVDAKQAYVSQQLGVLRRAGLLSARRDGPNVFYAVTDPRISELLVVARELLLDFATTTRDELSAA